MKTRNLIAILLCLVLTFCFAACGTGNPSDKPVTDPSAGSETQTPGTQPVETDPEDDEEEIYYYNPRIDNAYRKDAHTILFTLDTAVKDPDGNLYQHIYAAVTPDGEPIARAIAADSYEEDKDLSKIWGADFDVELPEKVYLCFEELEGEGNGDGEFETVLIDVVKTGVYAGTKLADGKRIIAVETTDNVINAVKWTNFPLADAQFVSPAGNEVQRDVIIEKTVLCTVVNDPDGYCEFTYTGSGLKLTMLCNVQDNGKTCYNVPALIMYLDGEEYATISMTDPEKYTWDNNSDVVFEDLTIPQGTHTVKFVNTTEGEFDSPYAYYVAIHYIQ